jgi:carbon monoxide dehydrogenase subunit G
MTDLGPVGVANSPCVIEYRGVFRFPIPPEELWGYLERVERFEAFLSWLSEFRLDGDGLQVGSVLSGVITPPLPYRMRLRVILDECEPPSRLVATVHGDLEGRAGLLFAPDDGGTRVTATWKVEMMQRPMRMAARVAHPLLRWGHDCVVEVTVRSFRRYLVGRRAARPGL